MKAIKDLHGVIVGLGSIGNRHMRILARQIGKLTVVRREQSNSQFKPLEGVAVVHSIQDAIATDPDFAVICNPSHLHVASAHEFLTAGIPALVEKPLGRNVDQSSDQLLRVVADSELGHKCAMAYCMRYHSAYSTAYRMVKSGTIGRCLYAKAWFEGYLPDWHPWEDHRQSYAAHAETAGGALRTLDHEIDFLNWVLGPAISSLGMTANTGAIEIATDDVAMVTSEHPGNIRSQITLAMCRKPPSRGFELIGDERIIRFTMESEKLTLQSHDGVVDEVARFSPADINSMYVDMVADYLNLLVGRQTSGVLATINDAIHALTVIDSLNSRANNTGHLSP